MGCCLSTHENKTIPNQTSSLHQTNPNQFPFISKSPPRPEEEAVKEVLSETPKPKPKPKPNSRPESPCRDDDTTKSKLLLLTPNKTGTRYPDPSSPEEISEVSEMCSFSESISTNTLKEEEDQHHHQLLYTKDTLANSTTTSTNSGEVLQKVYRSQGYNGNFSHHQMQQQSCRNNQGRSPARRRPEPSPPRRRYPGSGPDNSGRRSQSPGTRGNVGRSPSARRTGPSPGRVRMVHGPENGRKVEVEVEKVSDEVEIGLRRESEEWQGPKESLENPLVSLECFIFL